MKTITTNNRTLLFVEVPEDAMIEMSEDDTVLLYQLPPNLAPNDPMWQVPLPASDNNYRLIATTDTITEEQAAMLVKNNGMGCYDNHKGKPDEIYTCTTALESFATFLQHHSITGRHAIIEVL